MNKIQKNTLRHCPICGEESGEILHTQNFVLPDGHPLAEGYDVVCCDRCGFVYADTTVSQKDYDIFYAKLSKYEDNKTSTGGADSPYDAQRLRGTAECIAEFLPDKNLRILDIGCANGGLLGYLKELGYSNLYGIDPSPACVENTNRNYGIDASIGSLFQLPQNIGKFDVITLSHVLEHVQDLSGALNNLKNLLNQNGFLYVEVPDSERYLEFYVSPFHYFDTEHINHFSLVFLDKLLKSSGFIPAHQGKKEFNIHHQITYPGVWIIAQFLDIVNQQKKAELLNLDLRDHINEYIHHSISDLDLSVIDEIVAKQEPIIIWSVGSSTMRLLANSDLSKANIVAFFDSNPKYWGDSLIGKNIISLEELKKTDGVIFVTSKMYAKEIIDQIRGELCLRNKIVTF